MANLTRGLAFWACKAHFLRLGDDDDDGRRKERGRYIAKPFADIKGVASGAAESEKERLNL